jgi:WD40 repeat protein
LEKMEELAEPILRETLKQTRSVEVRQRVSQLLERLDKAIVSPEQIRGFRALETLEHINSDEAKRLLKEVASGAPQARMTQEAKRSLLPQLSYSQTQSKVLAFMPTVGRVVVVQGRIQVWDLATGKQIDGGSGEGSGPQNWAARCGFLSSDGKQLLTGREDGVLQLWDIVRGKEIRRFTGLQPPKPKSKVSRDVFSVALSPDGKWVVGGGDGGRLVIWNSRTGKKSRILVGHTKAVTALAFSQDGARLVSGSCDKTVRVWDSTTGQLLQVFPEHTASAGLTGRVNVVAFSADGKHVLSGFNSEPLVLWSMATKKVVRIFSSRAHNSFGHSAVFSGNGRFILSGGPEQVLLWEVATAKVVLNCGKGDGRLFGTENIAISPNGEKAVSTDRRSVILWDLTTGDEIRTLYGPPTNNPAIVNVVAFSPDGKLALSAGVADTRNWESLRARAKQENRKLVLKYDNLRLWDIVKRRIIRKFPGHEGVVTCAAFTLDGKHIVSGGSDNSIKLCLQGKPS